MENTIKETTRLLLQGNLTKDEADKILLDLHNVSQQRKILLDFASYLDDDQWFSIRGGYKDVVVDWYLESK